MIRKETGELVNMVDELTTHRKVVAKPNANWLSYLFRGGATGKTFKQVAGWYYREQKKWPTRTPECKPCPSENSAEWNMKIADVYPKFNRRMANAKSPSMPDLLAQQL